MVMKILKGLGAAISPGVRRGGTRRGSGSRYYRRNKKDGTVSAVSEQTLAKRGAAAAGAGAAGAGATGAALASDDSESTRRRVDRRGRPLKSQTNGRNETATEKSDNKRQTRRGMRAAPATTTPATKAKKYNVGVSKGGVPFAEAFDYYRNEKKQKTFTWNGKKYTTDLKDKVKTGTGKTGTGKTGTGKTSTEETSATKKSAGKKGLDRFRSRRKAGGGMMKKKGFSQGGLSEKSDGKRLTRRGYRKPLPGSKTTNYNVGVSRGGVPFSESFKYHKDKGQKTFTWNGKKYTTDVKAEGKTSTQEASASKKPDSRNRSRKRLMRKAGGGMMAKKGYAKGGMTKKGYKSGGLVNGKRKPRGVGAALRGHGKALK